MKLKDITFKKAGIGFVKSLLILIAVMLFNIIKAGKFIGDKIIIGIKAKPYVFILIFAWSLITEWFIFRMCSVPESMEDSRIIYSKDSLIKVLKIDVNLYKSLYNSKSLELVRLHKSDSIKHIVKVRKRHIKPIKIDSI